MSTFEDENVWTELHQTSQSSSISASSYCSRIGHNVFKYLSSEQHSTFLNHCSPRRSSIPANSYELTSFATPSSGQITQRPSKLLSPRFVRVQCIIPQQNGQTPWGIAPWSRPELPHSILFKHLYLIVIIHPPPIIPHPTKGPQYTFLYASILVLHILLLVGSGASNPYSLHPAPQ